MIILFYLPFRVAGKEAKGRPKRTGDCDLPRLLGNSTPSNAYLCDHSGQSAASQTRANTPLAPIGLPTTFFAVIVYICTLIAVL